MTDTSKGLVLTSVGALIMSFEALLIKLTATQSFKFSFYLGLCMCLSSAFILLTKNRHTLKDAFDKSFRFVLLAAFLTATSNIFFINAVKNTLVANVAIILATAPLFATFFSYVFYKIKPSKNIFVASFFIFLGLAVIFSDRVGFGSLEGNIYALICSVFFALLLVLLSNNTNLNRLLVICISGLFLAIGSFIFASDMKVESSDLLIIACMGLLLTPLSRLMMGNGTKFLNASEVSLLMIIETVMAPVWVWLILKEIPSINTLFGGLLIVLTLVLNSIYTLRLSRVYR